MVVRVVKVGGSLFSYDGLVPALRDWLYQQQPISTLLLPGGGPFADSVRQLDQRFLMESRDTHWLCVRLMDVTARLLHLLVPEAEFCDRFEELVRRLAENPQGLFVFSVEEFLQHYEPAWRGPRLPADWSVTSDSIAARLASALDAAELVLLKSSDVPAGADRHALARCGYVDSFFPTASQPLRNIRCVNLVQSREWRLD